MVEPDTAPADVTPPVLDAIHLRSLLVLSLLAGGTMTVSDLVQAVARAGFRVRGRAGKTISDALRWEVARGRVRRRLRPGSPPGRSGRGGRSP